MMSRKLLQTGLEIQKNVCGVNIHLKITPSKPTIIPAIPCRVVIRKYCVTLIYLCIFMDMISTCCLVISCK